MAKLIPKPRTILHWRNREWMASKAIAEFVDNSFAPGKGEARNVTITLDPTELWVEDDGHGVDDINRLFQEANHGEALEQDIGEFGVGATHAAAWLADQLHVETVHEGRFHHYDVNWNTVLARDEWPDEYVGRGQSTRRPSGTLIRLNQLRKKNIRVTALEHELGQLYAPALAKGRSIAIVDRRTNQEKVVQVKPADPPNIALQPISGSVQVAGQPALTWTGQAGFAPKLDLAHTHVEIGFGHRIIEVTKEPLHSIVAGVYARIILAPRWKHYLSDNKNSVVEYREELLASITKALQPFLELAARESSRIQTVEIKAHIEGLLSVALPLAGGRGTTGVEARAVSDRGPNERYESSGGTHKPSGRHNVETIPEMGGKAVAEGSGTAGEDRSATGVTLHWLAGEQFRGVGGVRIPGNVDMSNGRVVVILNEDLLILTEARVGVRGVDVRLGQIPMVIAALIADELSKNWRKGREHGVGVKYFPRMIKVIRDLSPDLVYGYVMGELLAAIGQAQGSKS